MEKIYEVITNTAGELELVFPRLTGLEAMVPGNIYNLSYQIETGSYRDIQQVYMYEKHSKFDSTIITDPNGDMPFAISTRDCYKDHLPYQCISQVVLKEDQYIMRCVTNPKNHGESVIYVMQVESILPTVNLQTEENTINVKYITSIKDRADLLDAKKMGVFPTLERAFFHINKIQGREFSPHLTPRYSFNPRRIITSRLFTLDKKEDRLVSYLADGTKLVINQKSQLQYKNPLDKNSGPSTGGFYRVFFGRRAVGEKVIYVDGVPLPMVKQDDLSDYIISSEVNLVDATSALKKFITVSGVEYMGWLSTSDDCIRPLYKTIDGYAKFDMNRYEKSMNSEIVDLHFNFSEEDVAN